MISVHGYGYISLPSSHKLLTIKNVLRAPKLIKNLISVCKFIHNNMVSVEFDPFGYSVKDLVTGSIILRSNSTGDFNSIKCNKTPYFVCQPCPLLKHIRLPFVNSPFVSIKPFEIIHSDLWTSAVTSPSGYKYYVLFLDHHTNFLWTFPLFRKSQVGCTRSGPV